ncbi:BrnT family toxin [Mesorhizobium sp. A623]
MQFEWDENKARSNKTRHGVGFELVLLFEFDNAIVIIDDDFDYGEERLKAIGVIHGDIYVLVYTEAEDIVRVISLRRANKTEARGYVESC